jgi:DNA primase large subunit
MYENYPKPGSGNARFEVFAKVHFLSFIKYASKLSGDAFKLIYQPLKSGWIPVAREEFVKILREAFVQHFIKEIEEHYEQAKALNKYFEREIEEIKILKDEYISKYSSQEFGSVMEEAFPPCLKSIIVKLKNGVNLPHQARFFLVTFLHKIGMGNEDIMKIFATAPDFNESMTRYQVEHITGGISKKEYEVPKCSTLQAYGLCIKDVAKDNLCNKEWMSHPLLYYKIKKEWLSKHKKPAEQQ